MSAGQYIRRAAGYFIKLVVLVGLLYLLLRRGYQAEGEIHHLTSVSAAVMK